MKLGAWHWESVWLKRVLSEPEQTLKPIQVYYGNMSAIHIAENPVQHDKSKHIEMDMHFIREKIEDKSINQEYIPTKAQLADLLNKPVSIKVFQTLLPKLGCINIYSQA